MPCVVFGRVPPVISVTGPLGGATFVASPDGVIFVATCAEADVERQGSVITEDTRTSKGKSPERFGLGRWQVFMTPFPYSRRTIAYMRACGNDK